MSHSNQGLETLAKQYRDEAVRLQAIINQRPIDINPLLNELQKEVCIYRHEYANLKADLEQAHEKLAILQAEKAEIEEENVSLQSHLAQKQEWAERWKRKNEG